MIQHELEVCKLRRGQKCLIFLLFFGCDAAWRSEMWEGGSEEPQQACR